MSNTPLISIVVPIYMVEPYLGFCIESIIKQTYQNLEIILVNDGSSDRCPEICDLYAKKEQRIKVIHQENKGLVAARKAGLSISTGLYVGYVDGDDWIEPDFYEQLSNIIVKNDVDVVCAGYCRDLFGKSICFYNHIPSGIYENESLKYLYANMLSYDKFYCPGITTYVWNKLFKRSILFDVQMNVDERISLGEDAAVTYPFLMDSNKIAIIENTSYHYRQHENSMLKQTTSFHNEQLNLRYLYEYLIKFANKRSNNYKLKSQITDYVLSICIIRSGGRCPNVKNDLLYSIFDKQYLHKKVIIYSAGTFGQQIWKRIRETKYCEIVGWIDEDYHEYRRCCLDVDPIEVINNITFDYILIATVDFHIANILQKNLLSHGIPDSKITRVKYLEEVKFCLLQKFLYH